MKLKKKILIGFAVVLAVACVSAVSIYAATNYGSSSDPLVTLSYLNDKFKPEMTQALKDTVTSRTDGLSAELSDKVQSLQARVDGLSGTATPAVDTFSVVSLGKGDTLKCSVGAELLLRIGTAAAYGADSPALVDTTFGSTLSDGAEMAANHMYMVSIADCGMTATSAVKVLVRGDYTIS